MENRNCVHFKQALNKLPVWLWYNETYSSLTYVRVLASRCVIRLITVIMTRDLLD